MSDDDVFRIILIGGFVAVFPFSLYFRMKSQATGERLDRRQEGWFILLTLRPVAAIRMLAILTYVINPGWMAWSAVAIPVWLRWSGVGIGVGTAVLLIATMRAIGPNLTDTVVTRKKHELVTRGPYHWVRHPFYVATGLALTADTLVTANWVLALTGVIVMALLLLRTPIEERKLIERFGDAYRDYMQRTGRFFPRIG